MFRRTFWFAAGAAAGVWATTKVNRKIQQLTPESLAAQAANKAIEAGHRVKDFALDVRAGMIQREEELGEALGVHAPVDPELPAQRARRAIARPPAADSPAQHPHHAHHSHNRNEDH
ncbi:DUF6167 family protein [Streptomyces sp. NPDC003860]